MEETAKPDYARCVDIVTKGALKEMILPGILAISAPIIVGDTVGDPFKDTAGPSLHVLIKLVSTLTLVFVALFS